MGELNCFLSFCNTLLVKSTCLRSLFVQSIEICLNFPTYDGVMGPKASFCGDKVSTVYFFGEFIVRMMCLLTNINFSVGI